MAKYKTSIDLYFVIRYLACQGGVVYLFWLQNGLFWNLKNLGHDIYCFLYQNFDIGMKEVFS